MDAERVALEADCTTDATLFVPDGYRVFEQAKAAGKTVQINDFFYELTR